jgi:hypothetical protein
MNFYLMSDFRLFRNNSHILSSSYSLVLLLFLHCESRADILTLLALIELSNLVSSSLRVSSLVVDLLIRSFTLATTESRLLLKVVLTRLIFSLSSNRASLSYSYTPERAFKLD